MAPRKLTIITASLAAIASMAAAPVAAMATPAPDGANLDGMNVSTVAERATAPAATLKDGLTITPMKIDFTQDVHDAEGHLYVPITVKVTNTTANDETLNRATTLGGGLGKEAVWDKDHTPQPADISQFKAVAGQDAADDAVAKPGDNTFTFAFQVDDYNGLYLTASDANGRVQGYWNFDKNGDYQTAPLVEDGDPSALNGLRVAYKVDGDDQLYTPSGFDPTKTGEWHIAKDGRLVDLEDKAYENAALIQRLKDAGWQYVVNQRADTTTYTFTMGATKVEWRIVADLDSPASQAPDSLTDAITITAGTQSFHGDQLKDANLAVKDGRPASVKVTGVPDGWTVKDAAAPGTPQKVDFKAYGFTDAEQAALGKLAADDKDGNPSALFDPTVTDTYAGADSGRLTLESADETITVSAGSMVDKDGNPTQDEKLMVAESFIVRGAESGKTLIHTIHYKDAPEAAWTIDQSKYGEDGVTVTLTDGANAYSWNLTWTAKDDGKNDGTVDPSVLAELEGMGLEADGKPVDSFAPTDPSKVTQLAGRPGSLRLTDVPDGWTVAEKAEPGTVIPGTDTLDARITAVTVSKDNASDVEADAKGDAPQAGTVFLTIHAANTGDEDKDLKDLTVSQDPLGLQRVNGFDDKTAVPDGFQADADTIVPAGGETTVTLAYALYDDSSDLTVGLDGMKDKATLPLEDMDAAEDTEAGVVTIDPAALKANGATIHLTRDASDDNVAYQVSWPDAANGNADKGKDNGMDALAETGVAGGVIAGIMGLLGLGGMGLKRRSRE